MKIAMIAPYFTKVGGTLPETFGYWAKTAEANRDIDFFVPTNVDISAYTVGDNIHFVSLTLDEFFGRVQSLFDFKISCAYYKTGEYRPFFGIIFYDLIKDYDYWGSTEFDVVYGNIMEFVKPYLDKQTEVIGIFGYFKLIRNTERLRNAPFTEVTNCKYPLTLERALSTDYTWFFDEPVGMGIRYALLGAKPVDINAVTPSVRPRYTYYKFENNDGIWWLEWKDGKLIGHNDKGITKEFCCIHFYKRKFVLDDVQDCKDGFCIIPGRIMNGTKPKGTIKPPSKFFTIFYLINRSKNSFKNYKKLSVEERKILDESRRVCEELGLGMQGYHENPVYRKIKTAIKKVIA